jgi:hypothetical protein
LKPTLKSLKIGATEITELMKKIDDPKMKVRCFFMILMNQVLMSRAGFYLCEKQVQYAWDLECVSKIDWCKVVYENLSVCILEMSLLKDNTYPGYSLILLVSSFNSSFV